MLAAVWDHPHDDLPRLVYADWLDDTGRDPARAEFIRVQCELVGIDDDDPRRVGLERREQSLRRKWTGAWKASLPASFCRSGYDRGFLAPPIQFTTVTKFLAMTADDLAPAPLWAVHLRPAPTRLAALLDSPNLLRVGNLGLGGWLTTVEQTLWVVRSPNTRNVTALKLAGNPYVTDDVLAGLSEGLPNLCRLELGFPAVTDRGLAGMADSTLAE